MVSFVKCLGGEIVGRVIVCNSGESFATSWLVLHIIKTHIITEIQFKHKIQAVTGQEKSTTLNCLINYKFRNLMF